MHGNEWLSAVGSDIKRKRLATKINKNTKKGNSKIINHKRREAIDLSKSNLSIIDYENNTSHFRQTSISKYLKKERRNNFCGMYYLFSFTIFPSIYLQKVNLIWHLLKM